jgi:hypothetical protein
MNVFLNLIRPCFKKEEKPLNELGLKKTIEKIKELNEDNNKICCYVGRVLEESIPKVEGEIWVSLDQYRGNGSLHNRLHLQVDFHSKEMKKLKGLFDKVVVDQNVTRGCHWWLNLGFLLKENPNSTLISPALPNQYTQESFYGTVKDFEKKQEEASALNPNSIIVISHMNRDNPMKCDSLNIDHLQFNIDFKKEKKYDARRLLEEEENTLRRTERVLKKFFTSVELIKGKNFPYKISRGNYVKRDHFILKGPQKDLYEKTCKRLNKMIEDRFRFYNI